jgi:hypothetical protein
MMFLCETLFVLLTVVCISWHSARTSSRASLRVTGGFILEGQSDISGWGDAEERPKCLSEHGHPLRSSPSAWLMAYVQDASAVMPKAA